MSSLRPRARSRAGHILAVLVPVIAAAAFAAAQTAPKAKPHYSPHGPGGICAKMSPGMYNSSCMRAYILFSLCWISVRPGRRPLPEPFCPLVLNRV